jgi:hypothetical protein
MPEVAPVMMATLPLSLLMDLSSSLVTAHPEALLSFTRQVCHVGKRNLLDKVIIFAITYPHDSIK